MNAQWGFATFENNSLDHSTSPPLPTITRRQGRSTTGCSNCKKRKVKCDERKPTCSRCSDRRLKCPGYPTNVLKWSAKHEIHRPCTSAQAPTASHSTTTRVTGTQEVASDNSALDSHDDNLDPTIPPGLHYAETAELYELPSLVFDMSGSSPYADSCQTTFSQLHSTLSDIEPVTALPATNSSFAIFEAPFGSEGSLTNAAAVRRVSFQDHTTDGHSVVSADPSYHDDDCVDETTTGTRRGITSLQGFPGDGGSNVPSASRVSTARSKSVNALLSPTILHVPTVLVEYYFRNVCRDCSTYDSSYNPFRSTVAEMQSNSAPLYYAIQSLAASKLADDMPLMRVTGIEAQGKALEHLKRESLAANGLHNVSEEVLCTILLLGMTTSWHVRGDLGVEYLILARRIITAKSQAHGVAANSNLEFYQNALNYWTMIVSIVSDKAGNFDEYDENTHSVTGPLPSSSSTGWRKIMPHAWTGVSPTPQMLFGQVLQLVRVIRAESNKKQSSGYSRAGIASIFNAITAAERLETKCWSLSIPSVDDIEDTEDISTPPVHHVLTAKAYLLSALLHIYMMFPDVLNSRIRQHSVSNHARSALEVDSQDVNTAHTVSAATVWPRRSSADPHEFWLRDLGLQIVGCLESIDVRSGTRTVHPPLLLSVASVLVLVRRGRGALMTQNVECMDSPHTSEQSEITDLGQCQNVDDLDARVRQCRIFIVNRLETMHALMRFHAIDNILTVVKEVWRRADTGSRDIFWMDIMHELRCESLFG